MADLIKLASKGVILAKVETTYGTDPVPVPATNAIRVEDPKVEPAWKKLTRNYMQPYKGARRQIVIGESVKVSFKTEVKCSGAIGTAPEIGVLFRGCGFTETIIVLTSVTYDPNSLIDSAESITIYAYKDGILRKIVGCRGTFSFECKAQEYGYISWDFEGKYAGPDDSVNPSPTWNETLPPTFVSAFFAYATIAAIIENLKVNVGNEIAKRLDANKATGLNQIIIKERKVTANIDPEVVALATKNWETALTAQTEAAITAVLGTTGGNKLTITAPKVVLDDLKDADRENIWTYDMSLICLPNAGNDEVKFAFT